MAIVNELRLRLAALLLIGVSIGALVAVAQTGSSGGTGPTEVGAGYIPIGGPQDVGDPKFPMALGKVGSVQHSEVDLSIQESWGTFELRRYFSTKTGQWRSDYPLSGPFGLIPVADDWSLEWWHSAHSYVWADEPREEDPQDPDPEPEQLYYTVTTATGGRVKFERCSALPCFAVRVASSQTEYQLYADENGFILTIPNDGRYYYTKAIYGQFGWGARLSRVESLDYPRNETEPRRLRYSLTYGTAEAPPECPGNKVVLSSIKTGDGAKLVFEYRYVRADATKNVACAAVLSRVGIVEELGNTRWIVSYEYNTEIDSVTSAPVEIAGRLAAVTSLESGLRTEYGYEQPDGDFEWRVSQPDRTTWLTKKSPLGLTDMTRGEVTTISAQSASSCEHLGLMTCGPGEIHPLGGCCPLPQWQEFTTTGLTSGKGDGAEAVLTRSYKMVHSSSLGTLTRRALDKCEGCVTATVMWDWTTVDMDLGGVGGTSAVSSHPSGYRNGNLYWNSAEYGVPQLTLAPGERPTAVMTHSAAGFRQGDPASAELRYEYAYEHLPPAEAGGIHQALLSQTKIASVLAGSEEKVVEHRYEPGSSRRSATFVTGWTREFANGYWTLAKKTVATFYLSNRQCSGEQTSDPLGRTLEVHGPCFVDGTTNVSDCRAGEVVPITQYYFYPPNDGVDGDTSTTPKHNANKLQRVVRYVGATTVSCDAAKAMTSSTFGYDYRGRALVTQDEAGIETTLAYVGDHLVEKVVESAGVELKTTYQYDSTTGKLLSTTFPDEDQEFYCYRIGAPGETNPMPDACAGSWSDRLQWKGRRANDASPFTERVFYDYQGNRLVGERYYDETGALRRAKRYSPNPLNQPTWEGWGSASHPSGFHEARRFDAAGNLAALGKAYNDPRAFCSNYAIPSASCDATDATDCDEVSTQPVSHAFECDAFAYDRANRIVELRQYSSTSSAPVRMCMDYDAQGNLASVRTGCTSACGTCTSPATIYEHDDFGNLLSVQAPWQDDGAGRAGSTRYGYDARGNRVRKQTPTMRAAFIGTHIEYAYDTLDRELGAKVGGTEDYLFRFRYDANAVVPPNCPDPVAGRTHGRLQLRSDSFGNSWYKYDHFGRVVDILRQRAGEPECSSNRDEGHPNSHYEYLTDGRLWRETYPHGRVIQYDYGDAGERHRVAAVHALTPGWTPETPPIIDNIRWEPYGGVREYQINAPLAPAGSESATVEFVSDDSDVSPVATDCRNMGKPGGTPPDGTGRIRGVWVSSGPSSSSARTGDLFKRAVSWKADQVIREDTCALVDASSSESHPVRTVHYPSYDQQLQLKQANTDTGSTRTTGGTCGIRKYTYDGRGNRTAEQRECWSLAYSHGTGTKLDRLDAVYSVAGANTPASAYRQDFSYDADGRLTQKRGPLDSSGEPAWTISFESEFGAGGTADPALIARNAAIGSVYRSVNVNGAVYEYFYDAVGRRRLKLYPTGATDEFFYDGDKLLEERGSPSLIRAGGSLPIDEYIWLDGRPVAMIKSKFDCGLRAPDFVGECTRNGEAAPCGIYFIISDHLKKPIAMFNSKLQLVGQADYEPFGHVNRVTYLGDTEHPYAPGTNTVLGYFNQPAGPNEQVELRARFAMVDTESQYSDYVYLSNDAGVRLDAGENLGGPHQGRVWSAWVNVPNSSGSSSSGRVHVRFQSDATPNSYAGVVLEGYEYRRYQRSSTENIQPVWTALRFPGQYYDAETDLFENWNRFYDPSTGRYSAPEPYLGEPSQLLSTAASSQVMPVYAYAGNSPVMYSDPTGLVIETNDAVVGYYLMELLKRTDDVGAGLQEMATDGTKLFTFTREMGGRTEWGGAYGDLLGKNLKGQDHYEMRMDLEQVNARAERNGTARHTWSSLIAHEAGHQYSRAYESQAFGVWVDNNTHLVWPHEKKAIDWQNAVTGDPKRPYGASRRPHWPNWANHVNPACRAVPRTCP